ncbi:glycoside hydrolase [Clathrospora elynae]|uniref:Glycoside hydrolase n=1 Tax=Clathrospora elynae TaxID=706981 RepID=A0A6A5S5T5_9PLEO|nr:glycoside hydrolase [Clathrospora elynae]
MKSIVLASALAAAGLLVGSASGRPLNHKRKLVTQAVYVTETVADVVVYIDQTGLPYSTTTIEKAASVATSVAVLSPPGPSSTPSSSTTPAPAPAPTSSEEPSSTAPQSSSVDEVAPAPITLSTAATSFTAVTRSSTSGPAPQPSAAAPDVLANNSDSGDRLPLGISYDAFSVSGQNTGCKSPDQIASEFSQMEDYKIVRVYGRSCNLIPLAIQNCIKNGQQLMGAVYLDNGSDGEDLGAVIQEYKDAIDQYAGGNWDVVQLFSVENERVSNHAMTAAEVIEAIGTARQKLQSLGYNGPVGAVETVPGMVGNPAICTASDVVMVNCHAFFDPNTKAQDAGTFVKGQVAQVLSACANKRVIVTESGWPHQGDANGAAVPSPDNQRIALQSIRDSFDHDMFLFSAFDTDYKTDSASTFNTERYWGVIQ